jgi:hypothetical protein
MRFTSQPFLKTHYLWRVMFEVLQVLLQQSGVL